MSDDAQSMLNDLKALAQIYKRSEVIESEKKGGPPGLHSEGFQDHRGHGMYSVGTILEGIANSLERKYGHA